MAVVPYASLRSSRETSTSVYRRVAFDLRHPDAAAGSQREETDHIRRAYRDRTVSARLGLIGYNAPAYFAFLVVDRRGVRIGFEWGVLLGDWAGLLRGDGRQVRYYAVNSATDLKLPSLTELLQEAAALKPPGRSRLLV